MKYDTRSFLKWAFRVYMGCPKIAQALSVLAFEICFYSGIDPDIPALKAIKEFLYNLDR